MTNRPHHDGRRLGVAAAGALTALALALPAWTVGREPDPSTSRTSSTSSPSVPLAGRPAVALPDCPAHYGGEAPWVPAEPPSGLVLGDRLVPEPVPGAALICAYTSENHLSQRGVALAGSRRLTGSLQALPDDLGLLVEPRAMGCTDMGGRQTDYLVALTYPQGVLWVSGADGPNGCVLTSNGARTANGVQ